MEKRLLVAGGAIGIGLLLVLTRLVQLTVVQGEQLARQASNQHQQRITLPSRRGAIFDRNGEPLALSVPAESLFIHPRRLPSDGSKWSSAIATAIHTPTQEVSASLRSEDPFVWLKRRATPQEAAQVRALGIAGIDSIETERRFYPQETLAAPLLGFTDVDARGIAGIEQTYDHYLREEPAEMVGERDAFGRTILVQGVAASPEILNIRLTLDTGLQYLAEQELTQAVRTTGAIAGTVVILDPQTFAVLALAQVPTFNPNIPAASRPEVRRNRIISDCYEPGSTMKVLLAAAALDTKRVRPEEQIFCEYGHYQVGKSIIHDHRPYGWLSFTQVVQESSNIGAAKVGERLGKETYTAYLRAFGLGRTTGIELPGESPGLLPPSNAWSRIHLVTASFGQGIAVTPLQLACAYAAIANDGVLMRPYLVREVLNADGRVVEAYNPQRLWQVVRTDTAHRVLEIMEKVVEKEGTGWRARIEGFRVAGKTGTSQKADGHGGYSARGRIASFIGIVPADRPRLVILVSIDEPKTAVYGGEVAAPVFQTIAQQALAQLGIERSTPKTEVPSPTVSQTPALAPAENPLVRRIATTPLAPSAEIATEEAAASEPSFLGMSLREAVLTAQRNGWQITTQGSGYVTKQSVNIDSEKSVYALILTPTGETRP